MSANFSRQDMSFPRLPKVKLTGIFSLLDNRHYLLVDDVTEAILQPPDDLHKWLDSFQANYDSNVSRLHTFNLESGSVFYVHLTYAILYWQYWALKSNRRARNLAIASYPLFSGTTSFVSSL